MFFKKNYFFFIPLCWLLSIPAFTQDQKIADSLSIIYRQDYLDDTSKMELLRKLAYHEVNDLRQALKYAEELISLSESAASDRYLRAGYFIKGTKNRLLGHLDEAMHAFLKSAEVSKKTKYFRGEGDAYGAIADIYSVANNHSNARLYYNKAIVTLRQSNDSLSLASALYNAGDEFRKIASYDSALLYFSESQLIFDRLHDLSKKGYNLGGIGMVYASIGRNEAAEKNINEAIRLLEETEDYYPICEYLLSMADIYLNKGDTKTALKYTLRSLKLAEQYALKEQIAGASLKLSEIYESQGNTKEALKHYKKHIAYRDSISNINTVQKLADLRTNYEVSQKQLEVDVLNRQKENQRNQAISLAVILALTFIILVILLKTNQQRQKAYQTLNLQKQETEVQKAKAEAALNELQSTQKQLIQTAKMASLGELTAGIAHEIQNPLNFVNNFSEVSVDLLSELRDGAVSKLADPDKDATHDLINEIADNLKKITYHGKRADSIVKGMLQHSRVASNKKEPTDINALAEEYLRLSYHGYRAKDKSFNVSMETGYDNTIEKISIVPEDIGRVLMNIYNNAFYAVHQKSNQHITGYQPKVWVHTKGVVKGGQLQETQIRIRDNGMGIPNKILDKIYQPFFTTKPTGQGTGLGLSLSYDIITNEHHGELKVETKEGEYTEFTIMLPNRGFAG